MTVITYHHLNINPVFFIKPAVPLKLFPPDDHGQRIPAVIELRAPAADIDVKLLEAGNHHTVAAHPGYDPGHRMGKVSEGL